MMLSAVDRYTRLRVPGAAVAERMNAGICADCACFDMRGVRMTGPGDRNLTLCSAKHGWMVIGRADSGWRPASTATKQIHAEYSARAGRMRSETFTDTCNRCNCVSCELALARASYASQGVFCRACPCPEQLLGDVHTIRHLKIVHSHADEIASAW